MQEARAGRGCNVTCLLMLEEFSIQNFLKPRAKYLTSIKRYVRPAGIQVIGLPACQRHGIVPARVTQTGRSFEGWTVQKLNRTSEIANWIRTEIDSGALAPGSKLEEGELSKRFQVSKTPADPACLARPC